MQRTLNFRLPDSSHDLARLSLESEPIPQNLPCNYNRGLSLHQHWLKRRQMISVLPDFYWHKLPSLPPPERALEDSNKELQLVSTP